MFCACEMIVIFYSVVCGCKEIGLEVNVEQTKYMVMSGDRNVGQNGNIKLDNKYFEMVEQFKYLGTTVTNRNSIQEEIKSRLKSRNAVIIRCRIFSLPVCCTKVQTLRYTEL